MKIESGRTDRLDRSCRIVAAGCLLLAVGVAGATWGGLLLVVLGHAVPVWVVSGMLLLASPVFALG